MTSYHTADKTDGWRVEWGHAPPTPLISATVRMLARFLLSSGVCLSVRPSVTLVHCIYMAEDIVKLLVRAGRPISVVILTRSADTKFQGTPRQRWRKIRGGGTKLRFSTEITVYLRNGTR